MSKNDFSNFKLPVKLENDYEYVSNLNKKLHEYLECVKSINNLPNPSIKNVEDNVNYIMESIKCYYNAKIDEAKKNILKLLNKYKSNKFVISDLEKNYAFRGIGPFSELHYENFSYDKMNKTELTFFKARIGNSVLSRTDMLHIPFNKRELIKTQRFSIPGVPCIYMGTTSYVCWLEMNKPRDNEFNVSTYKIEKSIKILNLVGDYTLLNAQIERCFLWKNNYEEENMQLAKALIEIFPLVYATSYSISNSERSFKSEYIISQLIMQCLEELEVDGIAYLSKKVENNFIGYGHCVNLAIPIKYNGNYEYENELEKYGELCEKIKLTEPVSLAAYQKIKNCDQYENKDTDSYINICHGDEEIELAGSKILYKDCEFSKFDKYLCSLKYDISEIYK